MNECGQIDERHLPNIQEITYVCRGEEILVHCLSGSEPNVTSCQKPTGHLTRCLSSPRLPDALEKWLDVLPGSSGLGEIVGRVLFNLELSPGKTVLLTGKTDLAGAHGPDSHFARNRE